jgi:hypothetical protein
MDIWGSFLALALVPATCQAFSLYWRGYKKGQFRKGQANFVLNQFFSNNLLPEAKFRKK